MNLMNKNKEKLVNALKVAINALKNDTIYYSWEVQSSCNMGVVAQALLGVNAETLTELRKPLFKDFKDLNEGIDRGNEHYVDHTWKNAVQRFCPLTGKPIFEIIRLLEERGLSKEDIVHLEYLENEAILAGSGIERISKIEKHPVGTKIVEVEVPAKNYISRILGKKEIEEKTDTLYEEKVTYSYPPRYHTQKENLIKYLVSWVKILTTEIEENLSLETEKQKLEARLLNAVAEEDYEHAARLRDQITLL